MYCSNLFMNWSPSPYFITSRLRCMRYHLSGVCNVKTLAVLSADPVSKKLPSLGKKIAPKDYFNTFRINVFHQQGGLYMETILNLLSLAN